MRVVSAATESTGERPAGGVALAVTGLSVAYGNVVGDTTIYVKLSVVRAEANRIKIDSKVKVVDKGLLGDKMIEISHGDKLEAAPNDKLLPSVEPDNLMGQIRGMAPDDDATIRHRADRHDHRPDLREVGARRRRDARPRHHRPRRRSLRGHRHRRLGASR